MTDERTYFRPTLEAAIAASTVSDALQKAWTGAPPQIATRQVWRARWKDEVQIVAVVRTDRVVTVVPLSLDPDFADRESISIAAKANPLGVPLVAWGGLVHQLPCVVLDRFLGTLTYDIDTELASKPNPVGYDYSVPQIVHQYRARLIDSIEILSGVNWVDSGSGQLSVALKRQGIGPKMIAATADLHPQKALAIWRGQMAINDLEAEKIAPLLGQSPKALIAGNPTPPSELLACLEQPQRHKQVLEIASLRGADLPTTYRALAYQTWALAARQTGNRSTNWDLRLDTLLTAMLNDQ